MVVCSGRKAPHCRAQDAPLVVSDADIQLLKLAEKETHVLLAV